MNTNLRKVTNLALKLVNEIRLKNGVSYNINTGDQNPPDGYMVAIADHEETFPVIDEEIISDYIKRHSTLLAKDDAYFGCWFDGHDYVLDVSEHYERKRDALFWAIVRKQRAIWDCARRDEINVKHKNHKSITRKFVENYDADKDDRQSTAA